MVKSKRTEMKLEFLSLNGINGLVNCTSAPRSVMDASHLAAHIPLLRPDERILKSGTDYEMGKYIDDVKAEENCVVKAVIPRYREYGIASPEHIILTEFEKNGEIYLDYIDVPTYKTNHSVFGYPLRATDKLESVSYNSTLSQGDILAKTDSYGPEGSYDFGLNANVALMSHPSVSDDGLVISESFAKRAQFTSISKKIININKNTIPLNLYGDDATFKFIPDIGQKVRGDGMLCATRQRNDWFSVYDLHDRNLKEVDVTFDDPVYVNMDSTVIDVKVIKGSGKQEFSNRMAEQLDHYAGMLSNFHAKVIEAYERLMAEKKALYGSIDEIRLTPKMHRFITDCYVKHQATGNRKYSLSYRKLPIDQYRIEITTMNVITPSLGFKITSLHADKGVVCAILPDHEMPVDKNGNRADLIADPASTIARMNIGRAYELYLGAASRDNRAVLIKKFTERFNSTFTSEFVDYAHQYLRGFYSHINSDMTGFIDSLNYEELVHHIKTVLYRELYLYYPPDNELNIIDVIDSIDNSEYAPIFDKVSYVGFDGKTIETEDKLRIGKVYIMFLEKIANGYSAVSSAKVNNFGFPVKGANVDKPKYPHSQNPIKFMGETECRILRSFMGADAVADMVDLASNPSSHKTLIREILESEDVFFNRGFDIDRNDIPYGQTKALQILNHVFAAAGFCIDFNHEDGYAG